LKNIEKYNINCIRVSLHIIIYQTVTVYDHPLLVVF